MDRDTVVKRNLDLLAEFMRYAFEHPDILDQIPKAAQLVILPEDDPDVHYENMKLVDSCERDGVPFIAFRMKSPQISVPSLDRIFTGQAVPG